MHFDPSQGSSLTASTSTLKRTLAQQATATARKIPRVDGADSPASSSSSTSKTNGRGSSTVFSPEFQMPTPSSSTSGQMNSGASWSRGGNFGRANRAAPPAFRGGKGKGKGKGPSSKATVFEVPVRDKVQIEKQFHQDHPGSTLPKSVHLENPKSALSNFENTVYGTLPKYESIEGVINGKHNWRYACISLDHITASYFLKEPRLPYPQHPKL